MKYFIILLITCAFFAMVQATQVDAPKESTRDPMTSAMIGGALGAAASLTAFIAAYIAGPATHSPELIALVSAMAGVPI